MQQQVEAQRYLQAIATRLQSAMVDIRTQVVVAQQPAAAILEYARDQAADLIAIATHGRGGAVRILLGSVADKIVRGASTPILLYRPPVETSEL